MEGSMHLNYKFTSFFRSKFFKKEYYFKGIILLQELKLPGYLDFFKRINFNNSPQNTFQCAYVKIPIIYSHFEQIERIRDLISEIK